MGIAKGNSHGAGRESSGGDQLERGVKKRDIKEETVTKTLTFRLTDFREQTVSIVNGYHRKEDANYRLQVEKTEETFLYLCR